MQKYIDMTPEEHRIIEMLCLKADALEQLARNQDLRIENLSKRIDLLTDMLKMSKERDEIQAQIKKNK